MPDASEKPPRKPRKPPKKKTTPSKTFSTKIANGSAAFLAPSGAIDGRSLAARRFTELFRDISSDIGGRDTLSAVQSQLVKRFAGAAVIAELAEAKLVAGGDIDVSQYTTLINAQNRLAASIGIRRAVIDATPTLEQYLASKAQEGSGTAEDHSASDDGGEDG